MARIIVVPHPHLSGLIAVLGLAAQLRDLGHDVTLVGDADVVERSAARGFETVRLPEARVKGRIPHDASIPERWRHRAARQAHVVGALGMDGIGALLDRLQPDLAFVDQEMPQVAIPLVGRGVPTAIVSTYLTTSPRPGVPPLSDYAVPGEGQRGSRAGIAALWARYRLAKAAGMARNWLASGRANRITALRQLAREHGFDWRRHVRLTHWLIPFNLVGLPIVYTVPDAFELPYAVPDDAVYLGCLVDESRRVPAAELPPDLARMLDRSGTDRRLVYCTFGTFFDGDDGAFLRRVVEALNAIDDLDVVIGLGGRGDPEALGPLAPHVLALSWVPQLNVLAAADAALVHAGSGTIAECLYHGVPLVTYPFDVNDQLGSASRVVYHGIGVLGDRETDDAAAIEARVRTVLDDAAYRRRVEALQAAFRRSREEDRLSSVVERMLQRADR